MKVLRSLNTFHIPYTRDNKSWKCSPVRKPCSLTSEINTAGLDYVQAEVAVHAPDTCTASGTLLVTILRVSTTVVHTGNKYVFDTNNTTALL